MKNGKREHFIIDGYNVINAWPELIAIRDSLEFARDKLIDILTEYGAFQQYDITIVFDAFFTVTSESYEQVNKNLVLIYTDEGETADSYIERLAYTLVREGKEVYVVTSDYAEQTVILGAGAYRVSVREFRKDIIKTKKKIEQEYIRNPALLSRSELGGRIKADVARKLDEFRKRR